MQQPYIPQVDNYNAIEAFVRRVYNPDGRYNIQISPYSYLARFDDLANGATAQQNIQIAANADFVVTNPRMTAFLAASGIVQTPMLSLLITDTGSQEQLMSEAVPAVTYCGQPEYANESSILPYPRIISGRSAVAVNVTNFSDLASSPVTYKRVWIVLAGVLVRGFGTA